MKRDVFVDVAQILITTKGYAGFSVQDVLVAANASKGAFYHYFEAKDELVDAVVNRMADQAATAIQPVLDDPNRSAVDKLEALFHGMARFKAERKDLVLGILQIWLSDDNLVVREKMRRIVVVRLVPWLEGIVRQGIAEGTFTSDYPEQLPRVLATQVQGMSELASELWVDRQLGNVSLEEVNRVFNAYQEAFERIAGAPKGTLRFLDEQTIEFWFG